MRALAALAFAVSLASLGCVQDAAPTADAPVDDAAQPRDTSPAEDAARSRDALPLVDLDPQLDLGPIRDTAPPLPEACDGVDNDADGRTDEDGARACPRPATHADSVELACLDGMCAMTCVADRWDLDGDPSTGCEYACVPSTGVDGAERCDGLDDDCDGLVDEVGALPPAPLAAEQRGVCAGLRQVCRGGAWVEPDEAEVLGQAELYEADEARCDRLDNDCDGEIDEAIAVCDAGCDGVDSDGDGDGGEGCVEVVCPAPGGGAIPPCNGCPEGTVIPAGFVCAPAGVYLRGSTDDEPGAEAELQQPPHPVRITRPFLMMATELTQGEWAALAGPAGGGERPAYFDPSADRACDDERPDECPVERVNWFDALWIANARSVADGLPACYDPAALAACLDSPGGGCPPVFNGQFCTPELDCRREVVSALYDDVIDCRGYRLPTEAEWEYAARAGTRARYWFGDDVDMLPTAGWCRPSSGNRTHPVGELRPNPWGLYDVHGNVSEWTHDLLTRYPDPPPEVPIDDPRRPENDGRGGLRVFRGGAFDDLSWCSAAFRFQWPETQRQRDVGLRLVRTVGGE